MHRFGKYLQGLKGLGYLLRKKHIAPLFHFFRVDNQSEKMSL